jgi:lysozyme family protein
MKPGNQMAASNFRPSLSLVLAHEGGYVNHPKDPGGATNKGVTQKVYDSYRDYMHLKRQSVRYIADSEVSDIYNKQYWRTIKGDSLPCGIDYAVFDFGVNSGISRAIKYLQRLVGFTGDDVDGVIGMVTLAAVERQCLENEEACIAQYCANRMAFLRSLSTFPTFGKGWTRRVIGYHAGVQETDNGVIDYATFMVRRDDSRLSQMPKQLEPTVRPVVSDTPESYVEAPKVYTIDDVRKLAAENDRLAGIIAGQ